MKRPGYSPTSQEMLTVEQADFYKRAFLAALTGTVGLENLTPRQMVEDAAEIAKLSVEACNVWKASQTRSRG